MQRQYTTIVEGGDYFEGARWRDGRWYVSDALKGVVCAFDESGQREDLMHVDALCSGLGWLPDGTLLVVSMKDRTLLARSADGAVRRHADLSGLSPNWINDMYVDSVGRAWVGTIGFAIHEGETPRPGELFRVDPDGTATVAATDLWCPNGVVVTSDGSTLIVAESFAARLTAFSIGADGSLGDRRVFAQFGPAPELAGPAEMIAATELAPDGMTIDSQDHVWVADANHQRCVRVSPPVPSSTRSPTPTASTSTPALWAGPTAANCCWPRPTDSSRPFRVWVEPQRCCPRPSMFPPDPSPTGLLMTNTETSHQGADSEVRYEVRHGAAWITLNRPAALARSRTGCSMGSAPDSPQPPPIPPSAPS